MASLTDILTAAKNIVTALNNAAQSYLNVQGVRNSGSLSAATLVQIGVGRICSVSVTTAGSAAGFVYDATSASATTNPVYAIPTTAGVTVVNIPITNGLVVAPGTGQVVMVSYS